MQIIYLVNQLSSLPKDINDRLMTLKLQLVGEKEGTIVSAYAPAMTVYDEKALWWPGSHHCCYTEFS